MLTVNNFKIELQNFLDALENQLIEFSKVSKILYEEIEKNLDKKVPNFLNERTLAAWSLEYFGDYLEEKEQANKIKNWVLIPEMTLNSKDSAYIDYNDKLAIDQEIEDIPATEKKNKNRFVPDGYLMALTSNNELISCFIEFKTAGVYKYIDMAIDYLKFKYYTNKSKKNHIFVYIIFHKLGEKTPNQRATIKYSKDGNDLQLINRILKKEEINTDASMYAFIPVSNNINNIKSTDELLLLIDNLKKTIPELPQKKTKFIDYDENPFYKSLRFFKPGKNVILSRVIRNSIDKVLEVDEAFRKKLQLSPEYQLPLEKDAFISQEEYLKNNVPDVEEFSKELASYLDAQKNFFIKDIKKSANPSEVTITSKKSLWILLIIEKFAKSEGIVDVDVMEYATNHKNKKENLDKLREQLNTAYATPMYKRNFNKLGLGLIFYLSNLYPYIGKVKNNKFIYKNSYLTYNKRKELIKNIEAIYKLLDYKDDEELPLNFSEEKIGLNLLELVDEMK